MILWERLSNAFLVIVIGLVLLAAYGVQVFWHVLPCPLCMLQRLGMIGVGFGALLNLRFGCRPWHYSFSLFSALTGGFVSLRHIALHVCPGVSEYTRPVIGGLSLYTWAFIVFCCSLAAIGAMLIVHSLRKTSVVDPSKMGPMGLLAFWFLLLLTVANIFSTLWQCGFGTCVT